MSSRHAERLQEGTEPPLRGLEIWDLASFFGRSLENYLEGKAGTILESKEKQLQVGARREYLSWRGRESCEDGDRVHIR